ncbi:TPA: hypothetical protein HA291_03375 [Candidatus Micrarchaeota archaeon]|jgi:hypothetical protein|nr:hypothetical protein [Candidatus Micrarchaeota archaeon]
MKLFPLNAGVSQIRGIIEIVKNNRGPMEISKIAESTKEDIADLFPLIDACSMLKLCTVRNGTVKLTSSAAKLTNANKREVLAKALANVEPFKSTIAAVARGKGISTKELSRRLYRKGMFFDSDEVTNMELLKSLLFKWGIENKLFAYNHASDTWSK